MDSAVQIEKAEERGEEMSEIVAGLLWLLSVLVAVGIWNGFWWLVRKWMGGH